VHLVDVDHPDTARAFIHRRVDDVRHAFIAENVETGRPVEEIDGRWWTNPTTPAPGRRRETARNVPARIEKNRNTAASDHPLAPTMATGPRPSPALDDGGTPSLSRGRLVFDQHPFCRRKVPNVAW